jgi:hypothetical protein
MSFIRDPFDNPNGIIGVARDITSRKQLEIQLQQAQRMEAMGTLSGGVAHDLNNILSGIVSYPELILMDLPEDSKLIKPILTIKKIRRKSGRHRGGPSNGGKKRGCHFRGCGFKPYNLRTIEQS